LPNQDRDKISEIGRARASTLLVHRTLMEHINATSESQAPVWHPRLSRDREPRHGAARMNFYRENQFLV
jgi:hypothetical protein